MIRRSRKPGWGMAMLAPLLLLCLFSDDASAQAEAETEWHSFSAGLQKAAKENKVIFLFVSTDWCTVCKKMESLVFPQPQIKPLLADSLVPVKIDAEDTLKTIRIAKKQLSEADIAARYQVDRYPTYLFLEPSGNLLLKLTGFQKPRELRAVLSRIAGKAYRKVDEEMSKVTSQE